MKPAVTIYQLSKALGLSPSTVSRALKNHPDIAEATRKRVNDMAAELDYEPNLYAVGLRTSNSKEIAVIVPNLSGFFYDGFITAVEQEARIAGYSLSVLLSGDNPEIELENLKLCRLRRVDAIMLCLTTGTTDLAAILKYQAKGTPIFFFDKVPANPETYRICVADSKAAEIAALEILKKSPQRVLAIFGNTALSITIRRLETFRTEFQNQGKEHVLGFAEASSSEEAQSRLAERWDSPATRPEIIFCMSDEILIGVMRFMQEKGISIPTEVKIIAISNGFFPTLYSPRITYIETSAKTLGIAAFRRVADFHEGQKEFDERIVPSILVQGGSF